MGNLLCLGVVSVARAPSGVDGVEMYGEFTETPLSVLEILISRSKRRTNLTKSEYFNKKNHNNKFDRHSFNRISPFYLPVV